MIDSDALVEKLISLALEEDIAGGDISTLSIIPLHSQAMATMTMKADGVISGLDIARRVFARFENVDWRALAKDGDHVRRGDIIIRVSGSYQSLLEAERTALNFLQRMSGIATTTATYVAELKGSSCQLLDTRKTMPGHRQTDKIAVRHGGGMNHRMGLYDMVMLKDNHIKIAGSITAAITEVRRTLPLSVKLEVETTNLLEVQEAIDAGADIIMLDNMDNHTMTEAVLLINGRARTEASGNMSIERIASVAATGVDFISVGALTHSVQALDISMNIIPE